jgi:hypothetical protein
MQMVGSRRLLLLTLLFLTAGSCFSVLWAQNRAEVSGRIVDQTGALLPRVSLSLRDETSGRLYETSSGQTGDFIFPFVPAGVYTLTAELPGFASLSLTHIHLAVEQELELQLQLKPGAPETSITVTSDSNRIDTKTTTMRHTIAGKEIQEMPVLVSPHGRQSLNHLILLVPGASDSSPNHTNLRGRNTTVNGSPLGSIAYRLDGADHTSLPSRTGGALSPGPNPDALREFTVRTGIFKAESGSHPVVVHMETKSGGDAFHGQLRLIHMNSSLTARDFFDRANEASGRNRNSIGGQFSGPVRLPGLYRGTGQTHFFFDLERTGERQSVFERATVLNEAERIGDFSDLPESRRPIDPLTGTTFPEGRIPEDRVLPQSRFYIDNLIARPTDGRLWQGFKMLSYWGRQATVRVDHQFSPKDVLTASFSRFDTRTTVPQPRILEAVHRLRQESPSLSIRHMHRFSPRLVNSVAFGRSEHRTDQGVSGRLDEVNLADYGFNIEPGPRVGTGLPRVLIQSTNNFDPGGWVESVRYSVWSWADDLSYTLGPHVFKVGGDMRWARGASLVGPTPLFQFAGFNSWGTGNDVADFLLGIPLSYGQVTAVENYPRRRLGALYFQDDFKVRPGLNLNLGIRYEVNGVWTSADGRNTVFLPGAKSRIFANAPTGILFPGDTDPRSARSIGAAMTPPDHNNLAPRIGLAYSPQRETGFGRKVFGGPGRTALRLGYGIFYIYSRADASDHGASFPPWFFRVTRSAFAMAGTGGNFADPWGQEGNPFPVPLDGRVFPSPVNGLMYVEPGLVEPYQNQWFFSIQRQLPSDLTLELAYIGNRALHLRRKFEANPGLLTPGASLSNLESRREYPGFGSVIGYASDGASSYNGLQIQLNRRFSSRLQFNAHYTWSRAMDNAGGNVVAGGIDGFADRDSTAWARSNSDRRHQFVFLFTTELPGLGNACFLRHFMSGWRAAGVYELRAGVPLNLRNPVDSTLTGAEPGTPDLVGSFRRLDPREVHTFTMPNGMRQTGNFLFDPTVFQSLYPRSREEARLGTLGRNSFTGPGMNQLNLRLTKRFQFGEDHSFELAIESLNAFNHPQFFVASQSSCLVSHPTFGMAAAGRSRLIQFALKYSF